MQVREMPTLLAAAYTSNTMSAEQAFQGFGDELGSRRVQLNHIMNQPSVIASPQPAIKQEPAMSVARIIKVFIADPNENLPLEKRVLYTGDEKLTDLTDQELFFEVPINEMLTKHNVDRVKTVDKTQAAKFGRDIFLEPAKIRDLKMVVVTVATF